MPGDVHSESSPRFRTEKVGVALSL
jgi:hypothetical protein